MSYIQHTSLASPQGWKERAGKCTSADFKTRSFCGPLQLYIGIDNKASFWTQTASIIPKKTQTLLNNLPFKGTSNDNQE